MAFDFSGKKILVTGAGSGIGRGVSLALAKAGCKVYALDCIQENLDKLASENSNVVPICQDLGNWEETKAAVECLDTLDGLVNNAGVVKGFGPSLQVSKVDLDAIMSINVFATINCSQVVGKKMVEAGKGGSIVNIASINSRLAITGAIGYNVSKACVDMVTKQFALELGPHNIRVNSVNPTIVDSTNLVSKEVKEASRIMYTERMPIARIAQIEEIVGPVLYLLSDYSAMVTGTTHLVDGGLSCNITTKS